ncbi:MAG: hypothetical protein R2778_12645 [Saprospiraceae bacterium]
MVYKVKGGKVFVADPKIGKIGARGTGFPEWLDQRCRKY